jgi:hypothetical protein
VAVLLLFVGLLAASSAFAVSPPIQHQPPVGEGVNDDPPGGGEGGDPDEVFAYFTPEQPEIAVIGSPEEPAAWQRSPGFVREWRFAWKRILFWSRLLP